MQYKHVAAAICIQFTPCKTIYSMRDYLQQDMELQGQKICKKTELEKKIVPSSVWVGITYLN